nr:MAG TPA: hypothetical protein [Caudoviricetes sp.]
MSNLPSTFLQFNCISLSNTMSKKIFRHNPTFTNLLK